MPRSRITAAARADLFEIGRFTLANWGLDQSFAYLDKLADAFWRVAEHPNIGKPVELVSTNHFQFPVGRHLVFYRVTSVGVVEIIRVLHQSMELEKSL